MTRNPADDPELRRALALSQGGAVVGSDGLLIAPPRVSARGHMGADAALPPYLASMTAPGTIPTGAGQRWGDLPQLLHASGPLDSSGILNTGRVVDLLPAQFGAGNDAGLGEAGPEVRLLELSGIDREAQAITLFLSTLPFNPVTPPVNLQTLLNGPIIGIVDFAVGGGNFTRLEIDLPTPKPFSFRNEGPTGSLFFVHKADGVTVTVPCSSVIVSARLDSKVFIVNGSGSDATLANSVFATRNNRMRALAYAAYNFSGKGFSSLRRTVYIANSSHPLLAGQPVQYGIPNFTKRIFFHRRPLETSTIQIEFGTSWGTNDGSFTLGPNNIGPIEISPSQATFATVVNTGAVDLTSLFAEHVLEI